MKKVLTLKKLCFDALETCLDIEYLENNLPKTVIYDFLNDKIENSYLWYEFFFYKYLDNSDLFGNWRNTTLKVAESIALKNLMDSFLTPYYDCRKKISVYNCGFTNNHISPYPIVCKPCFRNLSKQTQEHCNYRFIHKEIVLKLYLVTDVFCKNDIYWCKKCKINPLFFFNLDE